MAKAANLFLLYEHYCVWQTFALTTSLVQYDEAAYRVAKCTT